jgi:hypothetical protein
MIVQLPCHPKPLILRTCNFPYCKPLHLFAPAVGNHFPLFPYFRSQLAYKWLMHHPDVLPCFLRARLASGRTLAQIAEELGVSQPAVTQWLAGTTKPSKPISILADLILRNEECRKVGISPGLPDGASARQDAAGWPNPPAVTPKPARAVRRRRRPASAT